ncbi:TetR/AcrR family transcriptional regulator [Olivibacter sitiensis]|uniref:TetR/AcrR family transcriptional regulator n=1 Tax=Olivibacter sitiensis TaxID=376470 RepID=UPI0003FF0CBF|nr:TetR/AcrR family transcriptional regulator [Olivibacter sitiensis]
MDNQDKKRLQIVDAATKRFTHFGMAKTTMAEIAKDLSISKASLYYYFPDKMHLVMAVTEKLVSSIFDALNQKIFKLQTLEESIYFLLELKLKFTIDHYNLLEMILGTFSETPPELEELARKSHQEEINIISKLLQQADQRGEIKASDPDELAEIFSNAMTGMRFSVLKDGRRIILPSKSKFDEMVKKQKKLAKLIIKGLKQA